MQKLGEDIELCLRQLTFGTLRRSLRLQIAAEMTKYSFIGPYEGDILERMSLIEVGITKHHMICISIFVVSI